MKNSIMDKKKQSIDFWNQAFKEIKPIKINKKDIKINTYLDQYLKYIGDRCHSILDIGCGMGQLIIESMLLGSQVKKGVGIDASKHAIEFARKTTKLSNINGLSFVLSDESYLKTIQDNSFDGIICSNFLDVVLPDISAYVVKEIIRILKPGGYLVLKLNFYLDEALIKKLKMKKIYENVYEINGIMRSYNLSTENWINQFKDFKVIDVKLYPRAKNLPKDRVIVLKK